MFDRVGRFSTSLGMEGGRVSFGEETEFQMRARKKHIDIFYDPALRVSHLVTQKKMNLGHLLKRTLVSNYISGALFARYKYNLLIAFFYFLFGLGKAVFFTTLFPFRSRERYRYWQQYVYEKIILQFHTQFFGYFKTIPGKKVILVTNAVHPHTVPVYKYMSEHLNTFCVWYLTKRETFRSWSEKGAYPFPSLDLNSRSLQLSKGHFDLHLKGIFFKLLKEKPDYVIITGYDQIAFWQAVLYCRLFRKKYIVRNGTTLQSVTRNSGVAYMLKRWFVRHAHACVSYGSLAGAYLKHLGAQEEKIVTGCYPVDNDMFVRRSTIFRELPAYEKLKQTFPFEHIVFTASRLIAYKGIMHIIDAAQAMQHQSICFLIAGTGPLEQEYKKIVEGKNLKNIFFLGHIARDQIHRYYSIADLFFLPSAYEPWGVVVNESLACGTPVLCAETVGAAPDLIVPGKNGFVVDVNNIESVTRKISEMLQYTYHPAHVAASIEHCSIEQFGDAFLQVIDL